MGKERQEERREREEEGREIVRAERDDDEDENGGRKRDMIMERNGREGRKTGERDEIRVRGQRGKRGRGRRLEAGGCG
ncbi:hypothetical protein OIV57_33250 [Burkholderia pseudomallei]|uniref:hypothetical protein n=1 Tax=Burkholderia pseudomallei TaxID=28450 RepID=UPI0021F78186|nr:hypothetical protein [Burkholderia pseudomallei]MCV9916979.1 hypothetical protein [Burkholderia pseudomallei]